MNCISAKQILKQSEKPMDDICLRAALKNKILDRYLKHPTTVIIDELGLSHNTARIDLAVVNGIIHGYEIKSDRDTLRRLPLQIDIYNAVLDRVTLVVGEKHLKKASNAIPEWWGIKLAEMGPRRAVHFTNIRAPKITRKRIFFQWLNYYGAKKPLICLRK